MILTPAIQAQLLKLYPVLNQVPQSQLNKTLESANLDKVKANTLMWDENFHIQSFPFVLKGTARVVRMGANGRELHLYTVGPGGGCMIATHSMVASGPTNARAIANDDIEVIKITQAAFKNLVDQSEPFRNYVFADIVEHMAQLTELASAIAFQNLDQRLATALVAKQSPIQITHQALADELGSVREIISRILKNFEDQGWVALQRGQINVLKPQELTKFSNQA